MASSESDVELSSALTNKKTTKRPIKSPTEDMLTKEEPKKVSTKIMVHKALTDLKTRKGVSVYAIKKYIDEEYKVDTERISYYIKKYIKAGVENGTIVQTKGAGASGSFRLAVVKEKVVKKKKTVKTATEKSKKPETGEKPPAKKKKGAEEKEKTKEKTDKKKEMSKKVSAKKTDDKAKSKQKMTKEVEKGAPKAMKMPKGKSMKTAAKNEKTPKKKIGIVKRRSIGSIIKPPKMKPKVKA